MAFDLTSRAEHLREIMDDPDCDRGDLFRAFRQFELINGLLVGWRGCYARWIRPRLRPGRTSTLLDIGFGGGDIPRALSKWARRDGFRLDVTAIERDRRALEFVSDLPSAQGVTYRFASTQDLLGEGRDFDFVVTNNLLHHLTAPELVDFRDQVEALTRRVAIMNDIERSRVGSTLFRLLAPLVFRDSIAVPDGLTSIRRSFTRSELARALGPAWQVRSEPVFRLIATFTP
jgi:2-polyprenyl-3-methyl-5-hydroxy-6-metoxy-1,4-benzoquinol methylase